VDGLLRSYSSSTKSHGEKKRRRSKRRVGRRKLRNESGGEVSLLSATPLHPPRSWGTGEGEGKKGWQNAVQGGHGDVTNGISFSQAKKKRGEKRETTTNNGGGQEREGRGRTSSFLSLIFRAGEKRDVKWIAS